MLKRSVFLVVIILLSFQVFAQPKYSSNWSKDGLLTGTGVLLLGAAFLTTQNTETLTEEDISLLDRNNVNSFDRHATYNSSREAKTASDILLYSSLVLPVIPLVDKNLIAEKGVILLMYAETLVLNFGVTQLIKSTSLRNRPLVYNEEFSLEDKMKRKARYSFFSGHVSTVASFSYLSAAILNQYYKGRKFMPYVWLTASLMPLFTGYFRVESGKHFPTDVIAGYVAGSLIGLMVHKIHKVKKLKENGVSFHFHLNGFKVQKRL